MRSRIRAVALLACTAAMVSACAGPGAGIDGNPSGAIELAVSELCADTATDGCVSMAGEAIREPSSFEPAEVEDAEVVEAGGQYAVGVTFSEDGVRVLTAATEQVLEEGDDARLVIKIGDDILSAVRVIEPLETDHVAIALPPGENPEDVAAQILDR